MSILRLPSIKKRWGTGAAPRAPVSRVAYVFYWKRPIDRDPVPCVYESYALAEAAPFRCSDVVRVEVPL